MIKIGQSSEKSPADLRRLDVIQTPERNHQPTLGRKNSQKSKIVIKLKLDKTKKWYMHKLESIPEN